MATRLVGTRVDPAGNRVDRSDIVISDVVYRSSRWPQKNIAVASDGEDFLVTYSCRFGFVCARAIRSDGSLGESSMLGPGSSVEVIWNGQSYVTLTSRTEASGRSNLEVQKVGRDGTPFGPSRLLPGFTGKLVAFDGKTVAIISEGRLIHASILSSDNLSEISRRTVTVDGASSFTATATDRSLAVSWLDYTTIGSVLLDPSLTPSQTITFPAGDRVEAISGSWLDGALFVAAESRLPPSFKSRIRFLRFDFSRAMAGYVGGNGLLGTDPDLSSSSGSLELLWRQSSETYGSSAGISLIRLTSAIEVISGHSLSTGMAGTTLPSACQDGERALAAWVEHEGPFGRRSVRHGFMGGTPSVAVTVPKLVRSTEQDQDAPSVSCSGPEMLILYIESSRDATSGNLMLAVVRPGADPRTRMLAANALPESRTDVEWTGFNYVIAYTRSDGRMVTITYDPFSALVGSAIDMSEIPSQWGESDPVLTWSGRELLLLWKYMIPSRCQVTCPANQPALRGRVLDSSGTPRSRVLEINDFVESPPSAVWTGRAFAVSYAGYRYAPAFDSGTFVSLIDPEGRAVGTRAIGPTISPAVLFANDRNIVVVSYLYVDQAHRLAATDLDHQLQVTRQRLLPASELERSARSLIRIKRSGAPMDFVVEEHDEQFDRQRLFVRRISPEHQRTRTSRAR